VGWRVAIVGTLLVLVVVVAGLLVMTRTANTPAPAPAGTPAPVPAATPAPPHAPARTSPSTSASTPAKAPSFRVDVRDYGAKGNGSTDDYAAIQAAIDACGTSGGTVVFPRGTYLLDRRGAGALRLPAGNRRLLTLSGYGATIRLTRNVPEFLRFHRTADHQLFAHFRVEGFAVDAQDVSAGGRDVIGFGGQMRRIDVDDVTVRDCRATGLPRGGTREGINISCIQPTANEAVVDRITDITIDHCRVEGGALGFAVGGNEFGTRGTPKHPSIDLDNVSLTNCSWDSGVRSPTFRAASGAQMGWAAHGGRLHIAGCDFRGSSDNNYEINGWRHALIEDCVSEDATTVGYYVSNWASPLGGADGQQVIFRDCVHRQLTRMDGCRGWGWDTPSVSSPYGTLTLDHCRVVSSVPDGGGAQFLYSTPSIKARGVKILDCSYRGTGTRVTTSTWPFVVAVPGGGSPAGGPTRAEVGGCSFYFRATVIGTPRYAVRLLSFSGDPDVRWHIHDCTFRTSVRSAGQASMSMIDLGAAAATTGGGSVEHCAFASPDHQVCAVEVGGTDHLTIPTAISVIDCDFRALARGAVDVCVPAGDPNQAKVETRNNLD